MPVYEYQCQSCKRIIEKIQKFSDTPLTKCEKCGGLLKKVLSAPALVFKGSGFYITDYAQKKPEKEKPDKEKPATGKDQPSTSKDKESSPKTKESSTTPTTTPSSTPSSSSSSSPSTSSSKDGTSKNSKS